MGGRSSPGGLGLTARGLGAGSELNQLKNWASATGAKAIEFAASKEMPRQSHKKRREGCPIGAWITPFFVKIYPSGHTRRVRSEPDQISGARRHGKFLAVVEMPPFGSLGVPAGLEPPACRSTVKHSQ